MRCAQRLGECIGKGAFGSVYKAIHWGTGEAVAVKQIKMVNLPKSELRMIEVRDVCFPAAWWRCADKDIFLGGNRSSQEP